MRGRRPRSNFRESSVDRGRTYRVPPSGLRQDTATYDHTMRGHPQFNHGVPPQIPPVCLLRLIQSHYTNGFELHSGLFTGVVRTTDSRSLPSGLCS
jgi:hypothetical protein